MGDKNFFNIFYQDDNIKRIIPKLLKDQTTGKNIVWATDTYQAYGTVDDKLIFEMIDHSYDEVIKSFSKKVQKEILEN